MEYQSLVDLGTISEPSRNHEMKGPVSSRILILKSKVFGRRVHILSLPSQDGRIRDKRFVDGTGPTTPLYSFRLLGPLLPFPRRLGITKSI